MSPQAVVLSLVLAHVSALPAWSQTDPPSFCHATNARYNVVNKPKTGYDFVPVLEDDSLGFYVAYSAKQNEDNTGFVSTACMYVLPLENDEVLVFGGGFGDTYYLPGGAYFDADYDAAMVKQAITECMGRDLATARVRFVAPHGHPDHITVAFIRALERAGLTLIEIAYHEGDRDWIESLPWLSHHPALFHRLPGASCNQEILSYDSPLGHVWFLQRAGHTQGSIDLVIDVLGNPEERLLVLGSSAGGCPSPSGVHLTLGAHGTALVPGRRRAEVEVLTGQGLNRPCLTSVTPPKLGTSWVASFELSGHPDAASVYLFGSDCMLVPGVLTPFGEMLADPRGTTLLSLVRPAFSPDKEYVGFDIPHDATLMGRACYVQGTILGGGVELCNGLKLTIGF